MYLHFPFSVSFSSWVFWSLFLFNLIMFYVPDTNECDNSPCQNNAQCLNTYGGYYCLNDGPFSGKAQGIGQEHVPITNLSLHSTNGKIPVSPIPIIKLCGMWESVFLHWCPSFPFTKEKKEITPTKTSLQRLHISKKTNRRIYAQKNVSTVHGWENKDIFIIHIESSQ